ncbi:hypothetical protein Pan44_42690 [Caulifigura coniformis]|uniref:Uncharacterized protein n=1 Tax=Caulifigura coniformis TaxID=2527983 RepID=A0A517SJC7_9PLAN|nr:hypothetical protein [Caulifigura coniformis]QDT56217.1 hypothetical protein Pan44_42690 [Caulifigura coniformis]
MNRFRRRVMAAGLVAALPGCGPAVPLAPPRPASPVALQVAPGLGCSLQSAGAVYLVVNAIDAKNRGILHNLSEIIAGELRAATPAEVTLLVDAGLDCPPAVEWNDLCQACHVPIEGAPPSAVVVFCDILEYDPYSPLRVGLSMRVRRASDGVELVALQGTWVGNPPITPQRSPFHWLWKKGPPRPNVDYAWTAQFEAQSASELVRQAAFQCVASIQSAGGRPPHAYLPAVEPQRPAAEPHHFEGLVPPAPPALPEITPPPEPGLTPEEIAPPSAAPPITESDL